MPKKATRADAPLAKVLSDKIEGQLLALVSGLREDRTPLKDEVEELERLLKLQELVTSQSAKATRKLELIVLSVALVILVILNAVKLRSTAVELEVRATECIFTLGKGRENTLIPGEAGQILMLRRATVVGAESVDPPNLNSSGAVELEGSSASSEHAAKAGTAGNILSLQAITLSKDETYSVSSAVAYAGNARGLKLKTRSGEPVTALFGAQILVPSAVKGGSPIPLTNPIHITGKQLNFSIFPADESHDLALFRDVLVSKIGFEHSGQSTILGGTANVTGGSRTTLRPSDDLDLGDGQFVLREMVLRKGELVAILSTANARKISLGKESRRNLMPTIFQWFLYIWPNQTWAVLSAITAFWLATRKWWRAAD